MISQRDVLPAVRLNSDPRRTSCLAASALGERVRAGASDSSHSASVANGVARSASVAAVIPVDRGAAASAKASARIGIDDFLCD